MSITLIGYILKAAVRDRIILSFLFVLILGMVVSVFLGSAAITEKDQFTLVFLGSSLRLGGMMGLVLFVIFFVRRSFETKDVEFLLSRPISRACYILSHCAAFSLLAVMVAVPVSGIVAGVGIGHLSPAYGLWALSLLTEYIVMVNVALFFSMVLSSAPASAMITLAFYVLSRMIGQIMGIVEATPHNSPFAWLGGPMEVVSMIIPRIDVMAQSTWLVYGDQVDVAGLGLFIVVQGGIFTAFVVSGALFDLVRRQF